MWYVIYNTATGEKRGASALMTNMPDPVPEGFAIKEFDERGDQGTIWNTSALEYDQNPPSRLLSIGQFMGKLTQSERVIYYATRTAGVMTVKDALTGVRDMGDPIDMDDPVTGQMLDLLVVDGVITAERKAEILA